MKCVGLSFAVLGLFIGCNTQKPETPVDHDQAKMLINESIEAWDKAWETKDLELSLKYYADDTDWTNAFGDRVQSKAELRQLLETIFGLDFVMAGKNDYGENEVTFLSDSIATARSLNIRKNQEWPDGSQMDDRHINHLRVYENKGGEWLIINHMISQAWPKRQPRDTVPNTD